MGFHHHHYQGSPSHWPGDCRRLVCLLWISSIVFRYYGYNDAGILIPWMLTNLLQVFDPLSRISSFLESFSRSSRFSFDSPAIQETRASAISCTPIGDSSWLRDFVRVVSTTSVATPSMNRLSATWSVSVLHVSRVNDKVPRHILCSMPMYNRELPERRSGSCPFQRISAASLKVYGG